MLISDKNVTREKESHHMIKIQIARKTLQLKMYHISEIYAAKIGRAIR